jgi:hypothetical protein
LRPAACWRLADSLTGLLVGRALQGAGAVSAAVTALLADQTRDAVRTKAMALVGGSIGLMFARGAGGRRRCLTAHIGLAGLFGLTCALALAGVAVVLWWVPPSRRAPQCPARQAGRRVAQPRSAAPEPGRVRAAHRAAVDVGGRARHAGAGGLDQGPPLAGVPAGRGAVFRGHGRPVCDGAARSPARALLGAIGLVLLVQVGLGALAASGTTPTLWVLGPLMFLFFCGFNALEASQPSLVSRMAPAPVRGAALGSYNTLQSLGLFAGGALGGALVKWAGAPGLVCHHRRADAPCGWC